MGPEVGRMQARQKNREVTACDKCYGEMYGSGKMRAKQEQGWCKQRAGNTTQRRRKQARTGNTCRYQGPKRKHKQRATHCKMWLMKPLQRRLRIMR